ncbi:MAG: exosome complex RNA-binding protein Csl4 [Thermoplasmatota archaeon]
MGEKRVVLPGEEIGTTEEFLPGPGTYEESGRIYSALAGVLEIDPKEMVTTVRSHNPPVKLKVGDAVVGRVTDVRSAMVEVELIKVAGKDRAISDQGEASIHISHISDSYVPDTESQFRLLDYVRAKVIQVAPSIQLSTVGPDFGVIKALCSQCRAPLVLKGEGLYCESCRRSESRKVARSYGTADFWTAPTAEQVAQDQERYRGPPVRRGGRERGERPGGRGGWRGGERRDGDRRERGDRGSHRDERDRGRYRPRSRRPPLPGGG